MSETVKMPVLKTNKMIALIVVLAAFAIVIGIMTPLYLQNKINALYKEYSRLSNETTVLESDILQLKLKVNQYSSLERLRDFAKVAGLELNAVPVKVMGEGGAGE
ncbi:cell division protein FtsL [Fibrobacter sp. UWCM]|jgi:cell division protein FtsL|uniref:hypothetical protein n=1 Tax=Fibrobacter sp. TaxID=35828 RepID=UPI000915AED2|nr:hypothetical protein [Fibrobacter sp.]MBR4006274.1 hypothetical protein [Fibrobacter sp.]SHH21347.1 cell division protein FtsL [Fibrobacter sp. UWCM]